MVLACDVKSENLNAQPSTLENVAMNFKNKKLCFGQKSGQKKLKIRYLEIRLLTKKRPAKIKPRHVRGSNFLQKDRIEHSRKVIESLYM